MSDGKKNIICASIAALIAICTFYIIYRLQTLQSNTKDHVTVGFVYLGDGSTPYTANFMQAAAQMALDLGDKVTLVERFNVPVDQAEEAISELANVGCDIIFTNSDGFGPAAKKMAEKYSDIQFCAATCNNANTDPVLKNFHNFMGQIYQGRYICGMVAGEKLREMISKGEITEEQAVVGYVAAYPTAEVISGYTAFFLGVRANCPNATMKVKYANTWADFSTENKIAAELIRMGCVIISQDTDTIGPAIAGENADMPYKVYSVGYNKDMIDVAPTSSLISDRINWEPYITSAVKAVLEKTDIESEVEGKVKGNDTSGGLKEGWIKLLGINDAIVASGTQKMVEDAIADMKNDRIRVFYGDYFGVDPSDPGDTYDLRKEYKENSKSSAPSFHYVLEDVITIVR